MDSILNSYIERESTLLEWCKNKRVLHLGCVGTTDYSTAEKVQAAKDSFHAMLSACCECVGLDIDSQAVAALKNEGVFNNLIVGDAEALEKLPAETGLFDCVVAGDIIEHLSNPGRMLDGVKTLLKPEGRFIVSTPNALGFPNYVRHLRGRFQEGQQHVLSFNTQTLTQLLDRHGYDAETACACYQRKSQHARPLAFALMSSMLRRWPRLGGTLLFRCRPRAT